MIKITIKGNTYKVPNTFEELTISKYQELFKIKDMDKEQILDYIHILSGIDREIIGMMGIDDIEKITNNLLNFFNKGEYKRVEAVKIGKDTYVFDDNLYEMNFDMWIDLDELTKDQDDIIDNLHIIMAILYRKKKSRKFLNRVLLMEEYNSKNIKERANFFKENMMMDKVLGAMFFFINLKMKYMEHIGDYLEKKAKEMETENTMT